MCYQGDCKVRQHNNKAAKVCTSDMKEAGECFTLGRTIGRKRNAMSAAENWQKEERAVDDSRVKFGFSDDRSGPGRILRHRPDEEEVCVTPVKPSPILAAGKDENSAGRDLASLPLDVLVEVVCNLGHHELEPLTRVSKDFKQAVKVANETHFAFKTPDHVRRPNRSLFLNQSHANSASGSDSPYRWPATPMAPKRVVKHRNLLASDKEFADLSRVLFLDVNQPSGVDVVDAEHTICLKPGIATNRALFSADELSGALSRHCI